MSQRRASNPTHCAWGNLLIWLSSGVVPGEISSGQKNKYTVPAIQHIPTNTYMMESAAIAQFLESTYRDLPVPLTSRLGTEIVARARATAGKAFSKSVMSREIRILSPRGQEYFRRTREASFGHRLEDLLDPEQEESNWRAVDDDLRATSNLMQTNRADGPFVLGSQLSYADFFIAGSLQSARMVDEEIFQRTMKYPGYKAIYEACLPYMDRNN